MIRDRVKSFRRVKASELLPNPKNWRRHPPAQQDAMRGILAEVGFAGVVLARETPDGLQLIDGHLRAELSPDAKVPVLVLDVTEAEADKLLATYDPLGAMAEADGEALSKLLAEIETGSEALEKMLKELGEGAGIVAEPGELVDPEPQIDRAAELQKEWGTRLGQIWEVPGKAGVHRVMCGDSTKREDVGRLMGGAKAGLCFTSPPYAQQRDYTEASKQHTAEWDGLMQGVFGNLPMEPAGQVLVNLGLVHREGEWIPYWDGWIEWMRAQGWRRFGWYVWDQGSGLPGDWNGRLAPSHEFVWHFNREALKPSHCVRKQPNSIRDRTGDAAMRAGAETTQRMGSGRASLSTHKIPDSVFRVQRQCGRIESGDYHPAVFPVRLPIAIMEAWPGLVYDPFLGSGTTMVAAEQLGRVCYGIEISEAYTAVCLQRLADLGLKPELSTAEPNPLQKQPRGKSKRKAAVLTR